MPSKGQETRRKARERVEAELRLQGYKVNSEKHPFIVALPGENPFYVVVAGVTDNDCWPIRKRKPTDNLSYVLVRIDKYDNTRFFVMTQDEVNREIDIYCNTPKRDGTPRSKKEPGPGLTLKQAKPYENKWETLPS